MPALEQPLPAHAPDPRTSLIEVAWRIPRIDAEVPDARQRVIELARTVLGYGDATDNVGLAVSELLANTVTHGQGEYATLSVKSWPGRVRIEVHDDGPGPDPDQAAQALNISDLFAESGRGLFLVDQLTTRWGFTPSNGTTVWFEVDREADQ